MNRLNRLIFGTTIALLSILLAPSLNASAYGNSDLKRIDIATESWDVYTNADGSGLFLDIANAIFAPRGLEVDIKFVPYKRALLLMQRQQADAMFGTYSSEKEGKAYLHTPRMPIDKERTVAIFDKKLNGNWQGQTSLRDAQLAWVRGYDYHDNLEVEIKQFFEVADSHQGLNMLSVGRFDYFLDHSGALQDTISKTGFDTSGYAIETVIEENVYMAFANNERGLELARIYDEGIAQLIESGALREIFARYQIPYPF